MPSFLLDMFPFRTKHKYSHSPLFEFPIFSSSKKTTRLANGFLLQRTTNPPLSTYSSNHDWSLLLHISYHLAILPILYFSFFTLRTLFHLFWNNILCLNGRSLSTSDCRSSQLVAFWDTFNPSNKQQQEHNSRHFNPQHRCISSPSSAMHHS